MIILSISLMSYTSWHVCYSRRVVSYLVLRFLCEPTEFPELQLNTCNFSYSAVRGPARGVSRAFTYVNIRVGDLGLCVEGWHQPGADVFLWWKSSYYSTYSCLLIYSIFFNWAQLKVQSQQWSNTDGWALALKLLSLLYWFNCSRKEQCRKPEQS